MAVYRDLRVAVPREHVTINRGDHNRVLYVLEAPFDSSKGYPVPKRTTIGYLCPDDTTSMYPTSSYRDIFPNEWNMVSNRPAVPMIKKFGMYCAMKTIDGDSNVIALARKAFGERAAVNMIDYVMYSLLFKSTSTAQFSKSMSEQFLFSGKAMSDSHYSNLFQKGISQNSILLFKKEWALQCKKQGIENVWLCVDGSNDDCESAGVELAEKGHAKSHKNSNIVSFTYAVSDKGLPVTFSVYRGGLVDAKAMNDVINFLDQCGIRIRGIILDRGYCNKNTLAHLSSMKIPYVIMVKGTPLGACDIIKEWGNTIKMNVDYLIEDSTLFGIQKPYQIFKDYPHTDYLTLFYDYQNASDRITTELKHVHREIKRINAAIIKYQEAKKKYDIMMAESSSKTASCAAGDDSRVSKGGKSQKGASELPEPPDPPRMPAVTENMKRYVSIDTEPDGKISCKLIKDNLQKDFNEKGLYCILSSENLPASEIEKLYISRTSSEIQYKLLKTELGYGKIRIRFTSSLYAKFAIGFIASIVRYQIQKYAKSIDRNTTDIIKELNLISAIKVNDVYTYAHTENERQINFFKFFDASSSIFEECIKEENNRLAGRFPTPRHRKPGVKPRRKNETDNSALNGDKSIGEKLTACENSGQESTDVKPGQPKQSEGQPFSEQGADKALEKKDSAISGKSSSEIPPKKRGVKPGTKRSEFNKDGTPRKKPGVPAGTKRSSTRKDGQLRLKPGPKPRSIEM